MNGFLPVNLENSPLNTRGCLLIRKKPFKYALEDKLDKMLGCYRGNF
jgi:hypothetical protein